MPNMIDKGANMSNKFYISDWHYGHANVLAFDNRPFKTIEEMDNALVERWNAVVKPGDTVSPAYN